MISICMIVKNEEKILEKCLSHLVQLGYEIVIADTGSTDRTKEIAAKYTNKVYDFKWKNDFAAARNFITDWADNEYVLHIDCDEIVTSFDIIKLELLIYQNSSSIGRLFMVNDFTRGDKKYSERERVSRLYPKSLYQYEGIIHEQIVRKDKADNTYYEIPVETHHEGYDGILSKRKEKTNRNIALLKKQLEEGEKDPYILYQLGKSYYMQEAYKIACDWFSEALFFDLNPRLEYVQDMVVSYGYALINTKQYDTAMKLLNVYDEFAVNADFVFLAGLIYMNNAEFKASISEFSKAAGMKESKMEGVNSYLAFYNMAVIYECLGTVDKAKEYYLKCNDYVPAKSRLEELMGS